MPDLEPLFELKENLYKEICPVVLESGALEQVLVPAAVPEQEDAPPLPPETRNVVRMTFRNIDSRAVTALFIDLHVFDKVNNETEVIRDRRYLVPVAGRDETFGGEEEIPVGAAANSFSVAIKKVEFEGEDVWNGSASLLFDAIPARQPLESAFPEAEALLEQYRRDFSAELAEKPDGAEAVFVPETYKDLWLCACGEINRADEEKCFACGAAYEPQRALFDDREKLQENLEAYEKAEAEKAEQARLEAERRAAEEKAAAEEAERRAAEEKAAAEEAARKKRLHRKIFLSISIPLFALAAIFAVVLITYLIPQSRYDSAAAMLEGGRYDEAIEAFAELGRYSDSTARITEAEYGKAAQLLENGKYDEAIAAFEALGDYSDSKEQITEAEYRKALKTLDSGAYNEALKQLEPLEDYKDAKEKIELCYFGLGMKAVEADDVEAAAENYAHVNADHAVEMQKAFCEKGIAAYNAGDEAHAQEYFDLVTEKDLLPEIDAAYYARGLQLVDDKDFDGAIAIFEKLGGYEDCAEQIRRAHYLKAEALYDAADYAGALEEFEASDGYDDAGSRITETTYQLGVQQLNNGNVVDSYYTLYAIRGNADAYALLVSDSRYYIYVYDVGVGPNPLDE